MNISSGIALPLAYLTLVQEVKTLAELKVVSVVWGYDTIIGVESEAMTFTDIMTRTSLSKRSVQAGIKAALKHDFITSFFDNEVRFYRPSTRCIPHDHDHGINSNIITDTNNKKQHHDHEAKSIRDKIYQTLLTDFGMALSQRVASDIALSPKYDVARLQDQIMFTKWEVKHGLSSGERLHNPAGRLVYRIKQNRPPPKDFAVLAYFEEIEKLSEEEIFQKVYDGVIDAPDIKESMLYFAWLSTKRNFDGLDEED